MKNSSVFYVAALCALAVTSLWGNAYDGPRPAVSCTPRDGVGHALERMRTARRLNIAYFGGSITEMEGWRTLSRRWLSESHPGVKFDEIAAAIGGTGSDLGVYRYGHDVLEKSPDLVFVEFATNDSGAAPEDIWRNFDGFIRQTWKVNPKVDFVFFYTITAPMTNDYARGLFPRAASAMEQLADYYGIPSVGFGPRVMEEVKAGRLLMQGTAAEATAGGRTLFAEDGTHPGAAGHALYLETFKSAWRALAGSRPADHAAKLSRPFFDATLEAARMVPLGPDMFGGGWRKLGAAEPLQREFGNLVGQLWAGERPGDRLTFTFRGTKCRVYDLLGPDCGAVWVKVDGKPTYDYALARFDSWSWYHRLAGFPVYDGADGVHRVEITIDAKQPSREPIHRLRPQEDLSQPKYKGTRIYVGSLLLVGEVLREH